MSESLLQQAKKRTGIRGFLRQLRWILLVILIGSGGYYYYTTTKNGTSDTSAAPEFAEYTASRGDISVTTESDGTIKNVSNVELNFEIGGKVDKVNVKEGQKVKQGDVIAELNKDDLEFALQKAEIDVGVAEANLASKMAGATDQDVSVGQKNVELAQISLDDAQKQNELNIKNAELDFLAAQNDLDSAKKGIDLNIPVSDAEISSAELDIKSAESDLEVAQKNQASNSENLQSKLEQSYEDALNKADLALIEIKSDFKEADMILEVDLKKGYELGNAFSFREPQIAINAKNTYRQGMSEYKNITETFGDVVATDTERVQEKVAAVRDLAEMTEVLMKDLVTGLDAGVPTNGYTREEINSIQSGVVSNQSQVSTQKSNLDTAIQNIDTAQLNLDKQTLADNNTLLSAQNKLASSQKNLEKIKANNTSSDTGLSDKVVSAEKSYETAKLQLENTKQVAASNLRTAQLKLEISEEQFDGLTAPVPSTDLAALRRQIESSKIELAQATSDMKNAELIAPIDGEIMQLNISAGETVKTDNTDPLVVILSENNFEVETNIDEADIAKVQLGQTVYVTFDALENVRLEGTVDFIASTATTGSNGIVTYLVKSPVTGGGEAGVKEGMTAYVSFVGKEAKNVISIPVSAVKNVNGKPSVEMADGSTREVTAGFTDGKMVEIISGLQEGEKVMYKK